MTAPPSIGLVTCASLPGLTEDDRQLVLEVERKGCQARSVVWSDPGVRWTEFDLLFLRSCWDYHRRYDAFLDWLRTVEHSGVELINPPDVVRWNAHKGYLAALAGRGAAIVESVHMDRGSRVSLASVLQSRRWLRAVVKPAISASAEGIWCAGDCDAVDERRFRAACEAQDIIVQRFVPELVAHGEWSVLFLGGAFTHAVLKRAAPGDFRVQAEWGGSVVRQTPHPAMVSWAHGVADLIPHRWFYARVDVVETANGYLLMEVECIEPELFFLHAPDACRRTAQLLARRAARARERRSDPCSDQCR